MGEDQTSQVWEGAQRARGPALWLHAVKAQKSSFPLLGQADNVCQPLLSTLYPSNLRAQANGPKSPWWPQ